MKILVTGAKGFVGRNLCANLRVIRDGRNPARAALSIAELYEYDVDTDSALLDEYCAKADFVFNLAGANRPADPADFMAVNADFASTLLGALRRHGNRCPVMLASSIQAAPVGRYENSEYGASKRFGEDAFFRYALETGAEALVYRFPNLFGKWCRPNYNSAVATFCHNVARDLPIRVDNRATELELLYIDDLVDELLNALEGRAHRCDYDGLTPVPSENGRYRYAPVTHRATLGEIVDLLQAFHAQPRTLVLPPLPDGSLAKKLYSAYLSYLPENAVRIPLATHADARGSFTELLKTDACGQVSVNVSNPGVTKGQHWHNSKWEFFIVVSGRALIRQRRVGTDENGQPYPTLRFEVSGDTPEAVHMLPGYTHSIENLSDTDNLVTVMWANEPFDPKRPDTFFEKVEG